MAATFSQAIQRVVQRANQVFTQVQVLRQDIDEQRALINLTGQWGSYRIVVQEIYRLVTIRYSYYVLDSNNQMVHGFDNSPDRVAIQLYYGKEWKNYQHAEIPHQHDRNRQVTLTPTAMTFATFVAWLKANLG